MWISKRKWNEMEEKINMLDSSLSLICDTACDAIDSVKHSYENLKDELTELERAHKDETYTYIDVNRCTCTKRKYSHRKEEIKASTSNIVTGKQIGRAHV